MSVTGYISYFRQMAMQHKLMVHDEYSEVFDAVPSTCHFRPFSTNENFTIALPYTIADGPSLHLNMFDRDIVNDQLFAAPGHYPAGFIITRKVTDVDADADNAFDETSTIAADMLARMINDVAAGIFPLGNPDFRTMRWDAVGPIWVDRFGWRVSFGYTIAPPATTEELLTRATNAFNIQVFERQFEGVFQ